MENYSNPKGKKNRYLNPRRRLEKSETLIDICLSFELQFFVRQNFIRIVWQNPFKIRAFRREGKKAFRRRRKKSEDRCEKEKQ